MSDSYSQSEKEARTALSEISSINQLKNLENDHPDWKISSRKIPALGFTFDSLLFNTPIDSLIITQRNETSPKILSKIINTEKIEVCKVYYIYINGTDRSKESISTLRSQIMKEFNDGTPFIDLVKKYNEDRNPTGLLDWFYKGMMTEKFDTEVRARKSGEIFTVDIPDNNWYYVVLKNDDNKLIECKNIVNIELE